MIEIRCHKRNIYYTVLQCNHECPSVLSSLIHALDSRKRMIRCWLLGISRSPPPLLCLTLDTSGSASVAKPISERLRSDESTQNTNSHCWNIFGTKWKATTKAWQRRALVSYCGRGRKMYVCIYKDTGVWWCKLVMELHARWCGLWNMTEAAALGTTARVYVCLLVSEILLAGIYFHCALTPLVTLPAQTKEARRSTFLLY